MRRRALAAALLLGSTGCGGGLPLLHPARTLAPGEVRASGGFSANIAAGGLSNALGAARIEAQGVTPGSAGTVPTDATYAKGALVSASIGPGLAPFAGARVGVGDQFEGGIAYTGRAVRGDLRRSFDLSDHWSLSVGAGGSSALYGHAFGGDLPDVDLGQLHGWGADVPVMVGYESDGDLYMLWLGARSGWEHVDISEVRSVPKAVTLGTPPVGLSATRFWGGGLLGLAVGFRHVHVAMEVDASYATVTGEYNQVHAQVAGLTLAPATALWWRF